jgi:hypothetical protein
MIYRFKVTFEDHEEIYREIDIRPSQTFEELHVSIQKAIGFDNAHNAAFYVSDDYWRKGTEIILKNESTQEKKLMSKSKLGAFIDDPHQKFLYVFDFKAGWNFYVELIKILDADSKIVYPKISKSAGAAPNQYKIVTDAPPVVEDEDEEEADTKKEKIFNTEESWNDEEGMDDDMIEEGEDEPAGEDAEEPSAFSEDGADHEE